MFDKEKKLADKGTAEIDLEKKSEKKDEKIFGVKDSIIFLVENMLGAGIFFSPEKIAVEAKSSSVTLFIWVIGGVISALGAFCYIELGTRFPKNGGEGLYFDKAFGSLFGQIYYYLSIFFTWPSGTAFISQRVIWNLLNPYLSAEEKTATFTVKCISSFLVIILSLINITGPKHTIRVFRASFLFKVVSIGAIICGAILAVAFRQVESAFIPEKTATSLGAKDSVLLYTFLTMTSMWSYLGWNSLNVIGGKVKNPKKTFPVTIAISMLMVTFLYFVLNCIYLLITPTTFLSPENGVRFISAVVIEKGFSKTIAEIPFSLSIFVAILGSINGCILGGSHFVQAAAKRRCIPALFAQESKDNVPVNGVLFQMMASLLFIWFGEIFFGGMTFSIMNLLILLIYVMSVSSIFFFRRTEGKAPYRVRTPVAVLFILIMGSMFLIGVSSFWYYGTGSQNPFSFKESE